MLSRLADLLRISAYGTYIDTRRSFSQTALGTLWNAVGIAVAIAILGTFFGAILQRDLPGYARYIPFLASGLIIWSFVANCLNESCALMRSRSEVLRHAAYPFPAIPLSVFLKSSAIFLQNTVIAVIVYIAVLDVPPILFLPLLGGLVLVALNTLWMSQLAAMAALRFRDFGQLLSAATYLGFLVTPIIWTESFVGRFAYVFNYNPAYHLISLIRAPLLGAMPPQASWWVGGGLLIFGGLTTAAVYRTVRKRVAYWL